MINRETFERKAYQNLVKWKENIYRKPLILRGARQVGKTTLVKQFAKEFKYKIFLNLELSADRAFFERTDDVDKIISALMLREDIPAESITETLIFIDEIQECPRAISSLRFFFERIPNVFVIAAGSLLEHALKDIPSFPVGRVEFLYLFPINFEEFLMALNKKEAVKKINTTPVTDEAHIVLMNYFQTYAIIGGMPEVVKRYRDTLSFSSLKQIYEQIWETYKEDVEKYAGNHTEARVIRHIMSTAPYTLDKRIKFEHFGNSNYRSREVGEAFRKLDQAKIIQLIYPSTSTKAPLIPDLRKSPRMQFLDTGIINYTLNLQTEMIFKDDLSNEYHGAIIPHLFTQELISLNKETYQKPHFWVREKSQSSAEVDILIPHKNLLIPIEIKSGKTGKLRSLLQFMEQCDHPYAVRVYGGKFSIEEHQTLSGKKFKLMNLPYYLGTQINKYLDYFIGS